MSPTEPASADYRPEADVERLARYFAQRYGGDDRLLEARKALDPEVSFDLPAFEQTLRKWGVKVDNAVELFAHIDVDFSGSISVEELLNVLSSPVEEIKRRELQRQRQEVKRIFEGLARSISEKFGSIQDAFAKHGLHGSESSLSLAQFGKLAKQLDMELESAVMQRVFNEIDEDRTGSISVQELQKALMYHIVGYVVVEIANFLEQKAGGIVEAFEHLREIAPGAVPKVLPPVTPDAPKPPPPKLQAGEEGVSEQNFLRVLRQLKVLDQTSESAITESAALMIHSALKPFVMEDFVRRLQEEYRTASEMKQRQKEDAEKHEKDRKRRLAESLRIDSRQRAAKEIETWIDQAATMEEAPSVTAKWASLARSGRSKTQLRDYVSVLEGLIKSTRVDIEDLRRRLEREGVSSADPPRFFAGERAYDAVASPSVSLAPPLPPAASVGSVPHLLGTAPTAPTAPAASPSSLRPDDTMLSEHRTVLAERLLQAAACGRLALVQRCLTSRANINSVAWSGVTALMCAARHGKLEVLQLLLESSADPVRTDMLGRTALDHAKRQPPYVQEWLRGHKVLGRQEFERMVQALGSELLVLKRESKRLETMRDQIPSDDVLRRAKLINQLLPKSVSAVDHGQAIGSPYPSPGSMLSQGYSPLALGRAVSFPVPVSPKVHFGVPLSQ